MPSVVNADGSTETGSLIDDIVREGARRMLAAALEAEEGQAFHVRRGFRDVLGPQVGQADGSKGDGLSVCGNANSTACLAAHAAGFGTHRLAVDMGDHLGSPSTITATAHRDRTGHRIRVGGQAAIVRTVMR